ncbi:MAG: hypothetical protein AAB116_06090 [Candidatus Poribacteria bacterium]
MRLFLLTTLALLVFLATFAMAADKIVLITDVVPLVEPSISIKTHLTALGFTVEEHAQTEVQPVPLTGAAGVFIHEAIGSASITSLYNKVAIPIINTEAYILDDWKVTKQTAFDVTDGTLVTILDPNNAIAGGLKGDVKISTVAAAIGSSASFDVDFKAVAKATASGFTCLATFEKGIKDLDGVALPARRAYIGYQNVLVPTLTREGWTLLENTVLWALGRLGTTAVEPTRKLSLTWGSIKN